MKKSLEFAIVLIGLSAAALAQTNAPTHEHMSDSKPSVSQTPAQQSFTELKTLAGSWEGRITTTPRADEVEGKTMHVSLRVTSMGNAIVHEMTGAGRPDDPITMLYLDGDQVMLTHYCDAGNRPRMTGKLSPDGKTVEFDFLDIAGNTKYGHMQHAVFTAVDENHHTEEWTFMMPGDKPVRVRLELERTN